MTSNEIDFPITTKEETEEEVLAAMSSRRVQATTDRSNLK